MLKSIYWACLILEVIIMLSLAYAGQYAMSVIVALMIFVLFAARPK